VPPTAALQWTAGSGADFHDIYFGTDSIPPLIVQWFEGTFFDPDPDMTPGATYFWRIDERNAYGVTEGVVWHFSIMSLPAPATDPVPADSAIDVPVNLTLEWTGGQYAESHDVYLGLDPDTLSFVENVTVLHYIPPSDLLYDTTYYWRIDERNTVGVTTGALWRFTTETASGAHGGDAAIPAQYALGPIYPNPFNAMVTIPVALPQAGEIRLAIYDVLGREVAVLAKGNFSAGTHSVSWTRSAGSSGIYFIKLTTPVRVYVEKIVALK
jgi:hypothetical protein